MAIIYLGNVSPVGAEKKSNQITTVHCADFPNSEIINLIQSLWPSHSDKPAAWVETEDKALAKEVAELFSNKTRKCKVGKPEDWK